MLRSWELAWLSPVSEWTGSEPLASVRSSKMLPASILALRSSSTVANDSSLREMARFIGISCWESFSCYEEPVFLPSSLLVKPVALVYRDRATEPVSRQALASLMPLRPPRLVLDCDDLADETVYYFKPLFLLEFRFKFELFIKF